MTHRIRTHPGVILKEDFMVPFDLSANKLGAALGIPANRISDICRQRRGVTADTAIRLARYFETTEQFWMNLQNNHDLSVGRAKMADEVTRRIRPHGQAERRTST